MRESIVISSLRKLEVRPHVVGLIAFLLMLCAMVGWVHVGSRTGKDCARFLSSTGNTVFLVVGYLALLIGKLRARKRSEAGFILLVLILVTLAVHTLKLLFRFSLTRPTGSFSGFPSGHAAAAFALAFLLSCDRPRLAPVWFALAVGISWSRVVTGAHYPYQVYVGASLALLLSVMLRERVNPSRALHALARRAQFVLVAVVPTVAIFSTLYENENVVVSFGLGGACLLAGVLIRVWSRKHSLAAEASGEAFCDTGPYALIRHPTLVGNTLMCAGITMGSEVVWLVPLALLACATAYGMVARAEEESLVEAAGPAYGRYVAEVPRWIPRWRRIELGRPRGAGLPAAIRCELMSLLLIVPVVAKEVLDRVVGL